MKRIGILSFTEAGQKLSGNIKNKLNFNNNFIVNTFCIKKFSGEGDISFEDGKTILKDIFLGYDIIIFVSATGLAVRMCEGILMGKHKDPGIIVVDTKGRFVISLISGHIGGANEFTKYLAETISAVPVITTATDVEEKFSPDIFAVKNDLYIKDLKVAKNIASMVLSGSKVYLVNKTKKILKYLPKEVIVVSDFNNISDEFCGILITDFVDEINNDDTEANININNLMVLTPKNVIIGIGCKKNTDAFTFENEMIRNIEENGIDIRLIKSIHSIDLKKNEEAIWRFSRKYRIPVEFYTENELVNVSGEFSTSEFVKSVTGVDNVCERSAVINGGKLIVKKRAGNGITFAAAVEI